MAVTLDCRLGLTEAPDAPIWGLPGDDSTLDTWEPCGIVQLGEPGPITGGQTAARFNGASEVRDVLEPDLGGGRRTWSFLATAHLHPAVKTGTIMSIEEDGLDGPVRAFVVRARQFCVVAFDNPWGTGQVLWSSNAIVPAGRWTHVAATYTDNHELSLFIDGKACRTIPARIHPGRHDRQTVRVGSATRFATEILAGWQGWLQNIELYDDALDADQVRDKARAALGLEPQSPPAPAPALPAPPVRPDGWVCDRLEHRRAWTRAGHCLRCERRPGCAHEAHQSHWRPVGDVFSPDWDGRLECQLCLTTAATGAVGVNPNPKLDPERIAFL